MLWLTGAGMLVQEHIRSLANREPPVGWEEMMVETTEGTYLLCEIWL